MSPFFILQITDLHFGRHSRFAAHLPDAYHIEQLAVSLRKALHRELEKSDVPKHKVRLIAMAGDAAEIAKPGEFIAAGPNQTRPLNARGTSLRR